MLTTTKISREQFLLFGAGMGVSLLLLAQSWSNPVSEPDTPPKPAKNIAVTVAVHHAEPQAVEVAAPVYASEAALPLSAKLAHLLEAAQENQSAFDFEGFINGWIADLKESEIPTALIFLRTAKLSKEVTVDLTGRMVRHWAESNVGAASNWVTSMPAGAARELALENVAIVWAGQDLTKASSWATTMLTGKERDASILAIANEAVRNQPDEALRLVVDMPASPNRDDLIRRAATEYATQDQSAAFEWAEQIPDKVLRAQVFSGIALAWGKDDPKSAGDFVLQNLPAGRMQNDALIGIAQRWAETDPKSAAQWISSFPVGSLRDEAADSVASIWSQQDAKLAHYWLCVIKKKP